MDNNETTHPCQHCRFFAGRHEIETLDTMGLGHTIKVEIPVCGRMFYVLALHKCDNYIPTDLYMQYMQSKIDLENEIEKKQKEKG